MISFLLSDNHDIIAMKLYELDAPGSVSFISFILRILKIFRFIYQSDSIKLGKS